MDFRTRRQLTVIVVVLLIVAAIGGGAFWLLRPAPTCQDNRQNQGEEDVDCGGPCVPCAFRHQQPLAVFWVRFVKVRENTYDVAAEVRNPNVRLGAPTFDYTFKLLDTVGVAVSERRGRSYIYPGETIHLVEAGLTSGRTIERAAVTVTGVDWVLADAIAPDLAAGSKEYAVEGEGQNQSSVVKAIVTDRSNRDFPEVLVNAVVFDERGNLLGVHRTEIAVLRAGASEALRFVWPEVFRMPPVSILIEPRSRVLLPGLEP